MKIEPVKDMPSPRYPDKYTREVRNILAAAHPQRWRNKSLVVGALAATVTIGLSACSHRDEGASVMSPEQAATRGDMSTINASAATLFQPIGVTLSENISLPSGVVPLFEYGEGIGAFGCVSVASPYFMSEDEAFAILKAAFAEAKVELSKNIKEQQIILPANIIAARGDDAPETIASSLMLDGLANGMPVEFVSEADVVAWKYGRPDPIVSFYQIKNIAQTLSENNPGLVVFYDPVSYAHSESKRTEQKKGESREAFRARYQALCDHVENETIIESEQQLRNQVRAFIEWLNAEGMR